MDELNMFHVLADAIQGIRHGVRLSRQDDIASKTLVCFLDRNGGFHFGFGYENGSNLRVVCWENNTEVKKTVPKGAFVIAFHQQTTGKAIKEAFDENDFAIEWFSQAVQNDVKDKLIALNHKQDRLSDLIERLAGLTIQEIDKVNKKIDELRGN